MVNTARKTRVSHLTLSEIRIALRQYEQEVYDAKLSSATTLTYLTHAKTFVRWMHGEFTPGVQKKSLTTHKKREIIAQ